MVASSVGVFTPFRAGFSMTSAIDVSLSVVRIDPERRLPAIAGP